MYNQKSVQVSIYTVSTKDIQNNFNLTGKISKQGNINMLIGISKQAPDISKGASATVFINEKKYDGFLYNVSPLSNDLYEIAISVMTQDTISGDATASIIGALQKNVIIVPYSCIFTDERGNDAIMVDNQGFAVKRNVTLGKINDENGTEILEGVCRDEKVILSPQNIKTGDKIGELN